MNTRVFDLDNTFKSLQCEKLLLKFSKVLLGVHKKRVNFAVLSELGRSPLHFNIVISLVKYWYRLVNLSNESKLLDYAYIRIRIRILLSNRGPTRGKIITVIH